MIVPTGSKERGGQQLQELIAMGFNADAAQVALEACAGDVVQASEMLLSQQAQIAEPRPQGPQHALSETSQSAGQPKQV